MSPQFLTIAYFTKGNKYESLSQNLRQSCESFNIPLHLNPIEDLGSWEKNTHYKAKFILQCLQNFSQDLLYVDVDAVFRRYPDLLETIDCDLGYRTENFKWRKNEALSGTIFLRNNERTIEFVKSWILLNDTNPSFRFKPETWEQANMQRVHISSKGLKYFNLPPEYTFVFDHTRRMYPGLSPVIEHFQASRNK
jgi:hypothetical protein